MPLKRQAELGFRPVVKSCAVGTITGIGGPATATEDPGFDDTDVDLITIEFDGSGARVVVPHDPAFSFEHGITLTACAGDDDDETGRPALPAIRLSDDDDVDDPRDEDRPRRRRRRERRPDAACAAVGGSRAKG